MTERTVGFQAGRCARAVELINKTNQWNSTGERTDLHDVASRLRVGQRLFGFSVQDQFTSYGDVGFVWIWRDRVLQFVMSCRVVGLQVEECALAQIMRRLGCAELRVRFVSTPRNQPLRDYLSNRFKVQDDGYVIRHEALNSTPHRHTP